MRLIGKNKLDELRGLNDATDKWLAVWIAELTSARWVRPEELLEQFPTAKQRGDCLFLFTVKPSGLAVEVQFAFPQGVALVIGITEKY